MKEPTPYLRPVPANRNDAVPRAAVIGEAVRHRETRRRAANAERLADRRGQMIEKLFDALPRATKERIIGAGYGDLAAMSDVGFGAYLARVEIALGEKTD